MTPERHSIGRKEEGRAVGNFSMRFGTSINPDRGVCFRLWAPQADQVDLCLQGKQPVAMVREAEGWFRSDGRECRSKFYEFQA